MTLADDIIVLGGATGRVGGATLARCLHGGARVIVVSRSGSNARAAIERVTLAEQRSRIEVVEADLTRAEDGERLAAGVRTAYGRIDAVVSLAGGGTPFVPIAEATPDDLATSVANNLAVAFHLVLPALRVMLAQTPRTGTRSRGRLVAVTAGSSLDPQPRFGLMGVGKAGVNTLMRAIAREHKADGIVANAVILGGVATEESRAYLDAAEFAAAASLDEVADILAFHASDAASGVNGELIHLNARETD